MQHENCGICEKCIRTRLNFMAVGKRDPGCFADPFDSRYIGKLKVRNAFQLGELRTLLAYAKEKGIAESWVDMLAQRLKVLRYRRRLIDGIEKVGLRGPILEAVRFLDRLTRGKGQAAPPRASDRPAAPAGLELAWPSSQSAEAVTTLDAAKGRHAAP